MKLAIRGIPSEVAEHLWAGGPDANGQPPLRRPALGMANPCRHCLELIADGEDKLVLAHRPFAALQPYAETGPIFLHARQCSRYDGESLPAWFDHLTPARSYSAFV